MRRSRVYINWTEREQARVLEAALALPDSARAGPFAKYIKTAMRNALPESRWRSSGLDAGRDAMAWFVGPSGWVGPVGRAEPEPAPEPAGPTLEEAADGPDDAAEVEAAAPPEPPQVARPAGYSTLSPEPTFPPAAPEPEPIDDGPADWVDEVAGEIKAGLDAFAERVVADAEGGAILRGVATDRLAAELFSRLTAPVVAPPAAEVDLSGVEGRLGGLEARVGQLMEGVGVLLTQMGVALPWAPSPSAAPAAATPVPPTAAPAAQAPEPEPEPGPAPAPRPSLPAFPARDVPKPRPPRILVLGGISHQRAEILRRVPSVNVVFAMKSHPSHRELRNADGIVVIRHASHTAIEAAEKAVGRQKVLRVPTSGTGTVVAAIEDLAAAYAAGSGAA